MKSVLISIQPKWVNKIASGEKTIEVRKTRPKLETPFKCYIYCTEGDALAYPCINYPKFDIHRANNGTLKGRLMTKKEREQSDYLYANGKVIGEFVCDRICNYECELWNDEAYELIRQFNYDEYGEIEYEHGAENNENCEMLNKACLTWQDIRKYLGQGLNTCYAWHISDLKIYDKPKDLSEFYIYDGEKRRPSIDCKHKKPGYSHDWCLQMDGRFCNQCLCDKKRLKGPPQSWQYIEVGCNYERNFV